LRLRRWRGRRSRPSAAIHQSEQRQDAQHHRRNDKFQGYIT
jgi:hypothetical protein